MASGLGMDCATITDSWMDLEVVSGLGTEMMTKKDMVAGSGSIAGVVLYLRVRGGYGLHCWIDEVLLCLTCGEGGTTVQKHLLHITRKHPYFFLFFIKDP